MSFFVAHHDICAGLLTVGFGAKLTLVGRSPRRICKYVPWFGAGPLLQVPGFSQKKSPHVSQAESARSRMALMLAGVTRKPACAPRRSTPISAIST
jgi:hypothetical protein